MLSSFLANTIIGNMLCSTVFLGIVISLIGFKIYMIKTTKKCAARKRAIGKTCIVTGATSGIGREIAIGMVFRGARVILAVRDVEEAKKYQEEIYARSLCPKNRVAIYHLDLSSLASVRKFCDEIISNEERVDILINNAAASGLGNKKTADGLNIGMQINHFAPFLLTCLLIEKMKQTVPARIIWITSRLHGCAKFCMDNINFDKTFSESQVYFCSKLANILVANELARRLSGTGITVNTVHPGFAPTKIWRHLPAGLFTLWSFILRQFFMSTFDAAQCPLYVAMEPHLENVSGKYFDDSRDVSPSSKALDPVMALKLFEKSIDLAGLKPEEIKF